MGLSLNLNGLLTGTPSKAGSYNFRVCAVDISEDNDCKPVSIEVEPEEECNIEVCKNACIPDYSACDTQKREKYDACHDQCHGDEYDACSDQCGATHDAEADACWTKRMACEANCNCEEKPEEQPEEPSGNGCFCEPGHGACTTNEDCPDETNAGLVIPGFCACPA